MARTSYGAESMTVRRSVPKFTGSQMASKYILGHNPRKGHFSSMEGVPARKRGGLTATTAPHKTDIGMFDSKHGTPEPFTGGFGQTGLTGES
jgi:hypothetical protein